MAGPIPRPWLLVAALPLLLTLAATEPPAAPPTASAAAPAAAPGEGLRLVGHSALTGGGLNADVWVHRHTAYVGTWSGPCPGTGVKVVDVSQPSRPRLLGALAAHPKTSAEDIAVLSAHTRSFSGDLLAVGLQACRAGGLAGVELWNVTRPARPARLGFLASGAEGVHELSLGAHGGRVIALLAVPFSEAFTPAHLGDLRVVDVTDPRRPRRLADWAIGRDAHLPVGSPALKLRRPFDCSPPPGAPRLCRGATSAVFAHSVSASRDLSRAYVSYWDAGAVVLDIRRPAHPRLVTRTAYPPDSEGDTHSAIAFRRGRYLMTTDEDFSPGEVPKPVPGDTWGFARIWDLHGDRPRQVARITTGNSLTNRRDGLFSVHNPVVVGDRAYLSWYSDGVRVYDVSDPTRPRPVASWVPPAVPDPTKTFGTHPIDWGVVVRGDLVFLSDVNGGLYILRHIR